MAPNSSELALKYKLWKKNTPHLVFNERKHNTKQELYLLRFSSRLKSRAFVFAWWNSQEKLYENDGVEVTRASVCSLWVGEWINRGSI